ncbi:MAG: iron transporter [Actinobacteria bacterium]|nr:iron transporter [Actinomycetota bacterium]MBW3646157.1 iron transporter [Actinomycetota bacterium]
MTLLLPPPAVATTEAPSVDDVVTHTLLNCALRELSGPEGQADVVGDRLVARLPRAERVLRARLRRHSRVGAHRFIGPVEVPDGAGWRPIDWRTLADLLCEELRLRTGRDNDELLGQVESSAQTMAALLAARPAAADAPPADLLSIWLASEQALVHGHRYHPSGKARSGHAQEWLPHAPEVAARFRLRRLAVSAEVLRQETATGGEALLARIAGEVDGRAVLPVHPGQWERLRTDPAVVAALADGRLVDLGASGPHVVPTSSVRTVWHPAGGFCKLSLDVRITNCVRRNAAYELTGAVALTELLDPVAADLAARHPGTALLREPAYRSVDLDGRRDLLESFGVIAREGVTDRLLPGTTPLLAAAVADEHARGPWAVRALLARLGGGADAAVAWWDAWVAAVLPPVLSAYFAWGVVFEPHLQNVLVAVDVDGLPVHALLRDLEGTKLIDSRWCAELAELPAEVATQVAYDAGRGWDRVVYCLVVNHLSEVLSAVADVHPELEDVLWGRLRAAVLRFRATSGDAPQLRALLSGVPLPAKANLLLRWERQADRAAGYVPVPNPLGDRPAAAAPDRAAAGQ